MKKNILNISLFLLPLVVLFLSLFIGKPFSVSAFTRRIPSSASEFSTSFSRSPIVTAPIKPGPSYILPSPIQPRKNGTVTMTASIVTCGSKRPYQENFRLCQNIIILDQQDNAVQKYPPGESCYNLPTDKSGYGKVSVPPGFYSVRPPYWCPPGSFCLMNDLQTPPQENQSLIADPYTWKINPQSFSLAPRGIVDVKALGYNRLVMCPISIEE